MKDAERRADGSADCVALLGTSAGGAVAIVAAAHDKRIGALVSVASFADLPTIIAHQIPWLPAGWLNRGLAKAERIGNFDVHTTSPILQIRNVTCPTLIAHGEKDSSVPFEDGKRLYAAAACRKEFYVIPGANHATMFARRGKNLKKKIADFISQACSSKRADD
jgi:hypothetical protein